MPQAMIDYQNKIESSQRLQETKETEEKTDMEKLSTFCTLESQPDPDFFQDNKDAQKKKKNPPKYSSTKVKARNLLTNASYRRLKQEDFEKTTFVLDVFAFLVYCTQ